MGTTEGLLKTGGRWLGMLLAVTVMVVAARAASMPPDTITGLQAWYKADAITGVADGGLVSSWPDSSGLGSNMLQAVATLQPTFVANRLNGLAAVYFDGTKYLSAGDVEMHSDLDGITVLSVAQSAGQGAILSKFTTTTAGRQWRLEQIWWDVQHDPASWNANAGAPIPSAKYYNTWQMVGGTWVSGTTTGYRGGQIVGTGAEPAFLIENTNALTMIGASNAGVGDPLLGYVSEIVVYNRALSELEMGGIHEYFTNKYQIVDPVPKEPLLLNINFQPAGAGVAGYLTDTGKPFQQQGDYQYGWSQDATAQAIKAAPSQLPTGRVFDDPRFDSFVYMRNDDFLADWQVALPNGYYYVRGIFGDPRIGHGTGIQDIQMNRATFTDATPVLGTTNTSDWDEHWGIIEVTDGRLKLNVGQLLVGDDPVTGEPVYAPCSGKLCFLQIQEVTVPEVVVQFRTATGWYEPGFAADSGSAYGLRDNGLTYGWVDAAGTPADNTAGAFLRAVAAARPPGFSREDYRLAALIEMKDLRWEMEVENGWYSVMAVFGDPSTVASANEVWVENVLYHDADYGRTGDWDLFLGELEVADGRLTIRADAAAAALARILYLQLTAIEAPQEPIPGDANGDGQVNEQDAAALAANWLKAGGALWEEGDFNGDGNVDDLDASILAANWLAGAGGASVPEPGTFSLLVALGGAVLLGRSLTRQRRKTMVRFGVFLMVLLTVLSGAIAAQADPLAPDAITGLQAWYKADAITGLADGAAVSLWPDSGPSGYNMTQAVAVGQPIWVADSGTGLPGVRFDGSNDYLIAGDVEVHGETGFTIVGMVQPRSTVGYIASKFDFATGKPWREWRFGFTNWDVQQVATAWNAANATSGRPWLTDPLNYMEPVVTVGRWNPGVATELFAHGQLAATALTPATATTETPAIFTIGADRGGAASWFIGYVNELAFYNRALSDTELASLREYLVEKYPWTPYVPPEPTKPAVVASFNFEPAATGTSLPSGWVNDTGGTYQAHGDLTYGWSRDMSGQTRAARPDQLPAQRDFTDARFDAFINTSDSGKDASWEIAVPNGTYWVRGVFGEPRVGAIRGNLMAVYEGTMMTDPAPSMNPTTTSQWVEHWGLVKVTDGRLTVTSGKFEIGENLQTGEPIFGQLNSKLVFLQVQEANVPDIAVNFQTATDTQIPGVRVDAGHAYGLRANGLTYGWLDAAGVPVDNTGNARNRLTTVVPVGFETGDLRFATLNHMVDRKWEIEVENGEYAFVAVFGETAGGTTYAANFVNIEGLDFKDPDYPYPRVDFDVFMGRVAVTDGRFTVDALDSPLPVSGIKLAAKIMYLELTRLGDLEGSSSAIPEPGTIVMLLGLGLAGLLGRLVHRR